MPCTDPRETFHFRIRADDFAISIADARNDENRQLIAQNSIFAPDAQLLWPSGSSENGAHGGAPMLFV